MGRGMTSWATTAVLINYSNTYSASFCGVSCCTRCSCGSVSMNMTTKHWQQPIIAPSSTLQYNTVKSHLIHKYHRPSRGHLSLARINDRFTQIRLGQTEVYVSLVWAGLSVDLLRLTQTVLSSGLGDKGLLWLLEAALAVEPLSHFVAFAWSAPGRVPLTRLVPSCLFEDKPNISTPKENIHKTENL